MGSLKKNKVLLLACGALAHEIKVLISLHSWDHLDLHCLPANLHNTPDQIPNAVKRAVLEKQLHYDKIFVVYADCGTGGQLRTTCDALGVSMIEGPHCYAFFDGVQRFADRSEITAFYLTDFLVRQFDAFVWGPLGLEKHPELRDMYFGNYESLVYLAQTEDSGLTEKAKTHAKRLGLKFERRFTGYGDLETSLAKL